MEITWMGHSAVLIEIDGEQVGSLPASFEIIPRCFNVKSYL